MERGWVGWDADASVVAAREEVERVVVAVGAADPAQVAVAEAAMATEAVAKATEVAARAMVAWAMAAETLA